MFGEKTVSQIVAQFEKAISDLAAAETRLAGQAVERKAQAQALLESAKSAEGEAQRAADIAGRLADLVK